MNELSPGAELAWHLAAGEANAARSERLEPEHLLLGLCGLERAVLLNADKHGMPAHARSAVLREHDLLEETLAAVGLEPEKLAATLRGFMVKGGAASEGKVVHRSEAAKLVFARAGMLAGGGAPVTAPHLLAALADDQSRLLLLLFVSVGVDSGVLHKKALAAAEGLAEAREKAALDAPTMLEAKGKSPAARAGDKPGGKEKPALEQYGRDLTRLAREGKLGPFIGRREVLLQVLQTLARKSKNNPILVGEAGVGKTAVVEALAVRAAEGKDPKVLGGKRIIELNMGSLLAGTKMRGEFEERLTRIVDEARADPDLIVFIDELHNLVGAGSAEGSADAANLLKPALARGEFRVIGATTLAEFRKHIEKDAALERRFDKVLVPEPSRDETVEILRGLKARWEEHHGVSIADAALEAAADLSIRFDQSRQLPDKAIDLVDRACAGTTVPMLSMGPGGKSLHAPVEPAPAVDSQAVARVLAEKSGVPLEIVSGHLEGVAKSRILGLEAAVKARLFGQDAAVEAVCRRLVLAHAGLAARRGPLGAFLLLGPTGVGKTELARCLARHLFGSDDEMIRLDMSEFMEEHSAAKLVGSPPGYVGYDEEGQLTGRLRTTPYAVVLLDEVEKAHAKVLDLFLQVFDEGRLTDSKGRTADARNAVFVMTSNLGQGDGPKKVAGFSARPAGESELPKDVQEHFRKEFLNRLHAVAFFRPLEEEHAARILDQILAGVSERLKKTHGIELDADASAKSLLLKESAFRDQGARELQRAVERLVELPLSRFVLDGKLKVKPRWTLHASGSKLTLK